MYKTTDYNVSNTIVPKEGTATNDYADNMVEEITFRKLFYLNKSELSDSFSSTRSVKSLKDCCTIFLSVICALTFSFVIVLWVVSLIADGPDEMHGCVVLWPIVAGTLLIAVLFLLLRCGEYCCKRRQSVENEPLGQKDSLKKQRDKESDIPISKFWFFKQKNRCVIKSYFLLSLALFCIMVASVVQFFTLDPDCYKLLSREVSELLLGYEVLAYASVVVLSILGCFITCFLIGVFIYCCSNSDPSEV